LYGCLRQRKEGKIIFKKHNVTVKKSLIGKNKMKILVDISYCLIGI